MVLRGTLVVAVSAEANDDCHLKDVNFAPKRHNLIEDEGMHLADDVRV